MSQLGDLVGLRHESGVLRGGTFLRKALTSLGFCEIPCKGAANYSFIRADVIRNCSCCNLSELSNQELDPFITSLINSLLLISIPY